MKCLDCGNTGAFVHEEITKVLMWYDLEGNPYDETSLGVMSRKPVSCDECGSTNIQDKEM